eukprot:TRINITY_DN2114_c0_g1_i2.p1 TRINITY_DN2114_c0_g1~~TRINITY_DN2114_c0_g1_i2.p1  ORF type:complete len:269 (+),score=52.82 TRINITY_DN2114_c0_g1_i2:109-915(+)
MSKGVPTTLNFYTGTTDGAKPYVYIGAEKRTVRDNLIRKDLPVEVYDVREVQDKSFTVDTSGFELLNRPTQFKNYDNDEAIKTEYYAEIETILKERTGANRVFIFDHTLRKNHTGDDTPTSRKPVLLAHVDQTPKAAERRVRRHMGEDAPELLQHRYALINVWRPIQGPVYDFPLAVCDFRSVEQKDLIPADLVYSAENIGETFYVANNPNHNWYYAKHMVDDEVLFLKCFDSDSHVLTPHTAFIHPDTRPEDPKRQSIEVRALVFFP